MDLPLNALYLTTALVVIFGCIFLGSSSAFNAIISASVVALGISYAIPPAINCLRGRKMLPETRRFKLPGAFGWFANLVSSPQAQIGAYRRKGSDAFAILQLGIAYTLLTTVFFVFPPELPVTGNNMNYCIVAFAIIIIISTNQWFVDGRKNFTGYDYLLNPSLDTALLTPQLISPRIDVDAMENGEVMGMAPDSNNNGVPDGHLSDERSFNKT